MKHTKAILLSALCGALFTTQAHCAAEFPKKNSSGYFDIKSFVERVENGELTDEEIRADMNKQNPPRRGPGGRTRTNYSTDTPAIWAASTNSMHALQTFIRLGADLNKTNQGGFTALMLAAAADNQEALDLLVQAGVDVNFQGIERRTALICAAKSNQLATMQLLIKAKANLNAQDSHKQTALISAIRESFPNPEIVRTLLDAKADTGIVDTYGKTASIYARNSRNYPAEMAAITQMLVGAGAQPEAEMARLRQNACGDLDNDTWNLLFNLDQSFRPASTHDGSTNQPNSLEQKDEQTVARKAHDGKPENKDAGTKKKKNKKKKENKKKGTCVLM